MEPRTTPATRASPPNLHRSKVAALKEQLEAETGVFARNQKLIFKGKVRRPAAGGSQPGNRW
jgi:hypothetical protein